MQALAGARVIVTRPQAQADGLLQQLQQQGAETLHLPSLSVQPLIPPLDPQQLQQLDWLLALSVNAVQHGVPWVQGCAAKTRFAAVGPVTEQALLAHVQSVLIPTNDDYRSEGLLAALFAQGSVCGQQIGLLKGEAGRPWLADQLRQAGAQVHEYCVYQRQPAVLVDQQPLAQWRQFGADIAMVTSAQSLQVLEQRLESVTVAPVVRCALVASSLRVVKLAARLPWQQTAIATSARDLDMIRAAINLYRGTVENDKR